MEHVRPFDLHRIFVGNQDPLYLLEIAARAGFLYIFTLVMFRLIGKRGMGHLSPFETVIIVALGTSLGDPLFLPDVPLTYGMVISTSLLVVARIIHELKTRFPRFEAAIESHPAILVRDGKIDWKKVGKNRIAEDELEMLLRENDVENVNQVRIAIMETSGRLTVFKLPSDGTSGEDIQIVPPSPPGQTIKT